MNKQTKCNGVDIVTAEEAVKRIPSSATVAILGAGGGITEATVIIEALAKRYEETSEPKDLTLYHSTGLGDRNERGLSLLAQEGLVKRAIGGHWDQSPRLAEMATRNEIEAYNLPMGVMSQLLRAAAAGQPGILTHVGIGTFIDPRQTGGRLNERTTEELVQLMTIGGKEWLFYSAIYPDVAIIRGTTADTDGYITMEDEITFLDILPMAQAVKNNGGIVIAQVQRLVKARTLHPKDVKVPGYLVDAVVVVPEQPQLYSGKVNRFMSGDFIAQVGEVEVPPLTERKVIARRALLEVSSGDVGNVGVGISDGIGLIAQEEGVDEEFTMTVETGPIGGVTAQGIFFGASINNRAVIDMASQFDFYDGGGLDVCFLSFAEVDQDGNVNVSRFNGKIVGTGGFINITSNSQKIVFSGTLTAGGLKAEVDEGKINIKQEGRFRKFIPEVEEITFNGKEAVLQGKEVIYITERAVFRLTEEGLALVEVAPNINVEKDIIPYMGFMPIISQDLKIMDDRLFTDGSMGIKEEWLQK